jgi:DNA-3-methyladenine glycosylase I
MTGPGQITRCGWCGSDPLYVHYHDTEWGVPCHHEQKLFEFVVLEGAQAGLSWITVLRKRENYRQAMHGFDASRMAAYGTKDIERLMNNAGIIRNRAKIVAAIGNAKATCELHQSGRTLDELFWKYVDGKPLINRWQTQGELPVHTPIAEALSKELKQLGFRFVGPTVIYSHMQATGMINDHIHTCFRHREVQQ